MIKKEIISKYQLKIKTLNYHNRLYYSLSKPVITDSAIADATALPLFGGVIIPHLIDPA